MIKIRDYYKRHKILSWIICAAVCVPWLLILWNFWGLWGAILAYMFLFFILPWILFVYISIVLIIEKKFKLLWYIVGALLVIFISYAAYNEYEDRKRYERNAWHREKYSQQLIDESKKTIEYYEDYELIKYNQDLSNEEKAGLIKELNNSYWIQ